MSYTSEALRRQGKVIVQDDDYEKFTRLGPHEAHYQDRLIGVAKLAPENLYHPVHDFMDTLSREQEVLVKYWSPCLESDSEAKVQFAKVTHAAMCNPDNLTYIHLKGQDNNSEHTTTCFAEVSAPSLARGRLAEVISDRLAFVGHVQDLSWFPENPPSLAFVMFPVHGVLVAARHWRHVAWPVVPVTRGWRKRELWLAKKAGLMPDVNVRAMRGTIDPRRREQAQADAAADIGVRIDAPMLKKIADVVREMAERIGDANLDDWQAPWKE